MCSSLVPFPCSVFGRYFVVSHGNFVAKELLIRLILAVPVMSKVRFSASLHERYVADFQDKKLAHIRSKVTL